MTVPSAQPPSQRVAALLAKARATRGRLIFAIDATASREGAWDVATSLQSDMFAEAARIGGLNVQLVFYGGDQVRQSAWVSDAAELVSQMRTIRCEAGVTQIRKVLRHIQAENVREKVDAAVFVGDAIEEPPDELCAVAKNLGVPVFWFQEGNGLVVPVDRHGELVDRHPMQSVEQVFRQLARLTGGAFSKFDSRSAATLGELLRAVAVFVTGGLKALADLRTEGAQKLLSQIRNK